MRQLGCEYEEAVLNAVESGAWSDALRAHARGCEDCAAAVAVDSWIARLAAVEMREHVLPDPAIVWMKAQLLRSTVGVESASRPLQIAQLVAYIVVGGGWAALAYWKWEFFARWLAGVNAASLVESAAMSLNVSFFAMFLIVSSATIVLALHTILAEE